MSIDALLEGHGQGTCFGEDIRANRVGGTQDSKNFCGQKRDCAIAPYKKQTIVPVIFQNR